jgi:hypothetical protein
MSKGHSIHAQRALEDLHEPYFINLFIRSDASRIDASCPPGHSNHAYKAKMDSYLGRLQVCHAADVLNSYCQSILGEILKRDAAVYEAAEKFFPRENPKSFKSVYSCIELQIIGHDKSSEMSFKPTGVLKVMSLLHSETSLSIRVGMIQIGKLML